MRKVQTFNEYINESDVNGKYNTVNKVIAVLGRRPSEEDVAEFVVANYKDVTGEKMKDSGEDSSDKIADIVGFYKFDIDDWLAAWKKATKST